VPVRPHRLVLWDIDGTLLSAGPVARDVFDRSVEAVLGREARGHGVSFSGKTDPQIALEIMERVGLSEGEARPLLPRVLEEMQRRLGPEVSRIRSEGRVSPGVVEIVTTYHHDPRVLQSVLTGNLLANARVKLEEEASALMVNRVAGPEGQHVLRDVAAEERGVAGRGPGMVLRSPAAVPSGSVRGRRDGGGRRVSLPQPQREPRPHPAVRARGEQGPKGTPGQGETRHLIATRQPRQREAGGSSDFELLPSRRR
jgi:hypothetical protein